MRLSRADRLTVAQLQSIAARHVSGQQQRIHDEFPDAPVGDEAAIAELRAVTTDPRLLTAAAAMYVDGGGHWYAPEALRLLILAGADEDGARKWRTEHPPRDFRFPQP